VVQYLIQERWLEARRRNGTVVASGRSARQRPQAACLQQKVEQLVVEANGSVSSCTI